MNARPDIYLNLGSAGMNSDSLGKGTFYQMVKEAFRGTLLAEHLKINVSITGGKEADVYFDGTAAGGLESINFECKFSRPVKNGQAEKMQFGFKSFHWPKTDICVCFCAHAYLWNQMAESEVGRIRSFLERKNLTSNLDVSADSTLNFWLGSLECFFVSEREGPAKNCSSNVVPDTSRASPATKFPVGLARFNAVNLVEFRAKMVQQLEGMEKKFSPKPWEPEQLKKKKKKKKKHKRERDLN